MVAVVSDGGSSRNIASEATPGHPVDISGQQVHCAVCFLLILRGVKSSLMRITGFIRRFMVDCSPPLLCRTNPLQLPRDCASKPHVQQINASPPYRFDNKPRACPDELELSIGQPLLHLLPSSIAPTPRGRQDSKRPPAEAR